MCTVWDGVYEMGREILAGDGKHSAPLGVISPVWIVDTAQVIAQREKLEAPELTVCALCGEHLPSYNPIATAGERDQGLGQRGDQGQR